MKYTTEYINSLPFKDYLELIAKELNDNGFRVDGKDYYRVYDDPVMMRHFMLDPVSDPKAMAYLKSIGLIENGRCPSCGAPMSTGQRFYWYDKRDPSKRIYLCYGCHKTNFHGDGHSMEGTPGGVPNSSNSPSNSSGGCLVAILFFPYYLLKPFLFG